MAPNDGRPSAVWQCPAAFGARRRSAPRSRHRAAGRASFSQHGKYHAAFGRCHASGAGSRLQTYYYFVAGKKVCILPRFRRDGYSPPGVGSEGPARPGGLARGVVRFFSVRRCGVLLAICGAVRRAVCLSSSRRAAAILGGFLCAHGPAVYPGAGDVARGAAVMSGRRRAARFAAPRRHFPGGGVFCFPPACRRSARFNAVRCGRCPARAICRLFADVQRRPMASGAGENILLNISIY